MGENRGKRGIDNVIHLDRQQPINIIIQHIVSAVLTKIVMSGDSNRQYQGKTVTNINASRLLVPSPHVVYRASPSWTF